MYTTTVVAEYVYVCVWKQFRRCGWRVTAFVLTIIHINVDNSQKRKKKLCMPLNNDKHFGYVDKESEREERNKAMSRVKWIKTIKLKPTTSVDTDLTARVQFVYLFATRIFYAHMMLSFLSERMRTNSALLNAQWSKTNQTHIRLANNVFALWIQIHLANLLFTWDSTQLLRLNAAIHTQTFRRIWSNWLGQIAQIYNNRRNAAVAWLKYK